MSAAEPGRVHDLGAERRAELLTELFRGSSGRGHLRGDATLPGPLTPALFLEHVRGAVRLGALPFAGTDGERVSWACIDLDVTKWGHEVDDPEALQIVDGCVQALALVDLRAVPERSRGKGWHVWVFFDAPVPARDVRAYLRRVALEAGARDETDLVCPRQDQLDGEGPGNGTYLPLCGQDRPPFTRFHQWDESGELLPVEDGELAAFLRDLAEHRSPTAKVPKAEPERGADPDEDHPCAWIVDELDELGMRLEGAQLVGGTEHAKVLFACPLHEAPKRRYRGGSAVFWPDGRGQCASAKCGKTWRSVRHFVELVGGQGRRPAAPPAEVGAYAYTGTQLETLRATADPALVRPYLPPGLVGLAVLAGAPKTGKTTLGCELALQGALAEEGMPQARTLIVCAERPARQLDAVLCRLDTYAGHPRAREDWTRRIAIAARGPDVPPRTEELLELDGDGLAALVGVLRAARDEGDPFRLCILDSLSRLKPPALDEDSPSDMTPWLGNLHTLAHEEQTCVVLVHHARKGKAGAAETDAFDAIRGAGAIFAVADVALVLRRPAGAEGERYRELLVRGNCVPDWRGTFAVCGEGQEPGTLHRWVPIDRTAAPELADVLEVGVEVSLAEVWRRATDAKEGEKPGAAGYETVARWLRAWGRRVETRKGPRNSSLVRRVR